MDHLHFNTTLNGLYAYSIMPNQGFAKLKNNNILYNVLMDFLGCNYKVATISIFYPIVLRIPIQGFKSITAISYVSTYKRMYRPTLNWQTLRL